MHGQTDKHSDSKSRTSLRCAAKNENVVGDKAAASAETMTRHIKHQLWTVWSEYQSLGRRRAVHA